MLAPELFQALGPHELLCIHVSPSLVPSRSTHSRDLAGKRVWYLLKLFLVLQPQNGADQ